jgi:hypothetical protein
VKPSTARTPSERPGKATDERAVLGWREWVSLPDFGVRTIKAKLDTGARTSSLHAFKLRRYMRDGVDMARFEVHPVQRSDAASVEVEAEVVDEREVRTSSGQVETRPVVVTTLQIGDARWEVEVTLTRRDEMGFRLLLGRQALRGRVLVDPQRSYQVGRKRSEAVTRSPRSAARPRRAATPGSPKTSPRSPESPSPSQEEEE